MSLKAECQVFLNQYVIVEPQYGWGWGRLNGERENVPLTDFQKISDAGSFHVRIKRFFSFDNELRGFCGIIEETHYPFNGFWTVCSTRVVGNFDFGINPCPAYNVEIGPVEPEGSEWPHIREGSPIYVGYASVKSE
jgi:hypothetical protein